MQSRASAVKAVELSLALGHPLSQALTAALGTRLSHIAASEGWRVNELSMLLGGYTNRQWPERRDRLAELAGATRDDVDRWISAEAERRRKAAA